MWAAAQGKECRVCWGGQRSGVENAEVAGAGCGAGQRIECLMAWPAVLGRECRVRRCGQRCGVANAEFDGAGSGVGYVENAEFVGATSGEFSRRFVLQYYVCEFMFSSATIWLSES